MQVPGCDRPHPSQKGAVRGGTLGVPLGVSPLIGFSPLGVSLLFPLCFIFGLIPGVGLLAALGC